MWRDKAVAYWINLISQTSRTHIDRELAPLKLSSGACNILMVLFRQNGMSQRDLCRILLVHKANITRALQKLEKQGFVRRKPDPSDSRTYRIYLTNKAHDQRSNIKEQLRAWDIHLRESLLPREQEELLRLLRKIAKYLHPSKAGDAL
ncbi:MAG: MarR family transcriptional regulator [Candidatus Cloacimonetes bacterium]|nr:MarR family transcriptional regulator [Candidatus Cloacimonadota bacterium]